jgi:NAD(P)-dependent dehydrogenase (short-subunit alcohol dehydrogenase family)
MPIALITGASRGLGLALARALATRGWTLILDARDPVVLTAAADDLRAATLGVAPLPALADHPVDELAAAYAVNVFAPLDIIRRTLPALLRTSGDGARHQLGRRGRSLSRLGRLRVREGRAGPPDRRARRRRARNPLVRRGSRRHAD